MKKLSLHEFIKVESFEDVIFEGFDDKIDPHKAKPASSSFVDKFKQRYGGNITIDMSSTNAIKGALVDFIADQLPNVRFQSDRLSLEDFVLKNNGDLKAASLKPELKPWFHMLYTNVKGWLGTQNQAEVSGLLQQFGGNITQLVDELAPEVTQKLQQGTKNGTN